MKKLVCLITVAALIATMLCLVACGSDKVPAGVYTVVDTTGDIDASWETAQITAQENGTGSIGKSEDGAFKVAGFKFKDGKITFGAKDNQYTCKDGKLTLKVDGGEVIFEKQ